MRNVYWKFKRHPFVLITIYPFQATLYFLIYCYFYLRNTVYMLSKIVWNYNQHFFSQNTAICLFYSDFLTRFRCRLNLTRITWHGKKASRESWNLKTVKQCKNKISHLKHFYTKAKYNNKRTGAFPCFPAFYEIFDEVLGSFKKFHQYFKRNASWC